MNDYISRQVAIDDLREILNDPNCPLFVSATVHQILESIPASDVRPVVREIPMLGYRPERYERYTEHGLSENGEMLYTKQVYVDEKSYAMYCPACGKRLCSRFTNFCPNCGCYMGSNG